MVGNAVPPYLAYCLAKEIKKQLVSIKLIKPIKQISEPNSDEKSYIYTTKTNTLATTV